MKKLNNKCNKNNSAKTPFLYPYCAPNGIIDLSS